jgi:hypothetical protein
MNDVPKSLRDVWDQLLHEFEQLADEIRSCDNTLTFEPEYHETPIFPFRAYANFSSFADQEGVVISVDARFNYPDETALTISADIAVGGSEVVSEWSSREHSLDGKGVLGAILKELPAIRSFVRSGIHVLRRELCPDQ